MGKTERLQYASWLQEKASKLQHPFARDSERMVCFLLELENFLPRDYRWRRTDLDGFRAKTNSARGSGTEAINQVYWEDTARNLEAWAIMCLWRGIEILDSGITSVNNYSYVSAAILARSLLELASVMITEANNINATIEKLPEPKHKQVIIVEGLEEIILRLIWGTRQSDTPDYLTQKNILTYIKKLTKNPNVSELYQIYEYLCEVAHPNVVGYSRFQANANLKDDSDIIIRMARDLTVSETQAGDELLEKTLWAFGWSAVCLRNSFHMIQETIVTIDKRFKIRKKAKVFKMPNTKIGHNVPCPCGSGKKFKLLSLIHI